MAFEVTATGSPSLPTVEGWGWAQQSTDTYNNYGWGTPAFAKAVQGFGHNTPLSTIPEFTLTAYGEPTTQGGTFTVPAFSTTGYSGGTQNNATLRLSATIAATGLHIGRMSTAKVPKVTLTGSGRTEEGATLSAKIPKFKLAGYGAGIASIDWPKVTLTGVATVEELGTLVDASACDFIELFPRGLWSLTASGTRIESGSASVTVPVVTLEVGNDEYIEFPHFWIDGRAA